MYDTKEDTPMISHSSHYETEKKIKAVGFTDALKIPVC